VSYSFFEQLTRVRVLIAQGEAGAALELSGPLAALAGELGRIGSTIELLLLQAIAQGITGRLDDALTALERSLTLAELGGYVRLYLDEGDALTSLLRALVARGGM